MGSYWRRWLDQRDLAAASLEDEMQEETLTKPAEQISYFDRVARFHQKISVVFCGFGLAFVHKDRLTPIPYYTSHLALKLIAVALIVVVNVVLSPEVVNYYLKENAEVLKKANPCTPDRKKLFMAHVDDVLERHMNKQAAQREVEAIQNFQKSLSHDVQLYGNGVNSCVSKYKVPETVRQWNNSKHRGKAFFPEWCDAEILAWMEAENKKTCLQKPDPECVSECAACWAGGGWRKSRAVSEARKTPGKWQKAWGAVALCRLPFPVVCANRDQKMNDALAELNNRQRLRSDLRRDQELAKLNLASTQSENSFDVKDAEEQASKFEWMVDLFMEKLSIATKLYSGYEICSLLSSAPLKLFKTPMSVMVKASLFSIPKYRFVPTMALILVGFTFLVPFAVTLRFFPIYLAITAVLPTLHVEPCFFDWVFLKEIANKVIHSCKEMSVLEVEYSKAVSEVPYKLDEVHLFSTGQKPCDCKLPIDKLKTFSQLPRDLNRSLWHKDERFTSAMNTGFQNTLYVPSKNGTFPGSSLICRSPRLLLQVLVPNLEMPSLLMLLFRSGVFSVILAQILLTNWILAALKLVDPFCVHGGRYLAPSSQVYKTPPALSIRTKLMIVELLRTEAATSCVVLGVILAVCFANLAVAFGEDVVNCNIRVLSVDTGLGLLCILLALVILCCTRPVVRLLRKNFFGRNAEMTELYDVAQHRTNLEEEIVCKFDEPVTISNASNPAEMLKNQDEMLFVGDNTGREVYWTMSPAEDGHVYLNGGSALRLADCSGTPTMVARSDEDEQQKWRVDDAGGGSVFLDSHRNEQLSSCKRQVVMHSYISGSRDKWIILTREGEAACMATGGGDARRRLGWLLLPMLAFSGLVLFCTVKANMTPTGKASWNPINETDWCMSLQQVTIGADDSEGPLSIQATRGGGLVFT